MYNRSTNLFRPSQDWFPFRHSTRPLRPQSTRNVPSSISLLSLQKRKICRYPQKQTKYVWRYLRTTIPALGNWPHFLGIAESVLPFIRGRRRRKESVETLFWKEVPFPLCYTHGSLGFQPKKKTHKVKPHCDEPQRTRDGTHTNKT